MEMGIRMGESLAMATCNPMRYICLMKSVARTNCHTASSAASSSISASSSVSASATQPAQSKPPRCFLPFPYPRVVFPPVPIILATANSNGVSTDTPKNSAKYNTMH